MLKTKRKISIKGLQKKCENKWKEYCLLRDGKGCQVRKFFCFIPIKHTDVFQVDHCFSRMDKNLFLDVRNGTVVCSTCNRAKGWKQKSVHRAIDQIVKMREGDDNFNEMESINMAGSPNHEFCKRYWLEEKLKSLVEQLEVL